MLLEDVERAKVAFLAEITSEKSRRRLRTKQQKLANHLFNIIECWLWYSAGTDLRILFQRNLCMVEEMFATGKVQSAYIFSLQEFYNIAMQCMVILGNPGEELEKAPGRSSGEVLEKN